MSLIDRLRNTKVAALYDLLMVPAAWLAAYWLRFNLGEIPAPFLSQAIAVLPILVPVQGAAFWYFGMYRGVWRFASIPDLIRIIKAVAIGCSLAAVGIFFATRMEEVPRSVFPLYAVTLVTALGGARLLFRSLRDRRVQGGSRHRTLIVGAGAAGEALARDLSRGGRGYLPVAFVDDDPRTWGRDIHGIPVVGDCGSIPRVAKPLGLELIVLAVPAATSTELRRIVELCEQADIPVRTLPTLHDLVSGRVSVSELREISIQDLLGREPVSLDWSAVAPVIRDKVVLVSGGGGSIGGGLCRQIASIGPKTLVINDASEFNLYSIEAALRSSHPDLELQTSLADVRDAPAIARLFAEHRPDVVFHAAAYKHVPILEQQVREAVRNNVFGTLCMARASALAGCDTFVLISTDKAVNPVGVMGATKRTAELVCQSVQRECSGTRFITVRFGNVLDSSGSVVPLFREQIARGGPVTVTDPEVERYFMTIPEACQLILQAVALGTGGDVFILEMGAPIKIRYLAEQMIRLAGKVPDEDIEIRYTGLRPGEKLREELFYGVEQLDRTGHDKILRARTSEVVPASFEADLERLHQAAVACDDKAVLGTLREIVSERDPAGTP